MLNVMFMLKKGFLNKAVSRKITTNSQPYLIRTKNVRMFSFEFGGYTN